MLLSCFIIFNRLITNEYSFHLNSWSHSKNNEKVRRMYIINVCYTV